MFDVIDEVMEGRWFKDQSPFRAVLQKAHPKLCVITGANVSGKSVLRKVLGNKYHDRHIEYINTSQEKRCAGGLERLMVYGTEDDESTGYNSTKTLLKAFQTGAAREKQFGLMLDEPEIGCSEETQAGIGLRIAKELDTMSNLHGMYVITHSRHIVKSLLLTIRPTHLRLGDEMTFEEWLDREIIPTDLDKLLVDGKKTWAAVARMTKKL